MRSESRKCLLLCLCFLFLGVLVGISIDAEFRPNRIRFWVNDLNDLSFIPKPGDTIEWLRQSTSTRMKIKFWGPSPCVDGITNPCTIGKIPKSTIYTYSCKAKEDSTFTCNDPQGGPMSSTQPLEDLGFFTRIFDLIENIFASFGRIFKDSSQTGAPRTTQDIAGNIAIDQTKIVKTPPEEGKILVTPPGINATVYCDASVTHVAVPQQSDNADDAILASVKQKIQWTTSSAAGFTITMADASTCNENVKTFGPNGICTVAKAGNYTASVPSCSVVPESIALQ
jgi:hypothetical protein